ncbi:hypothetical protein NQZ68_031488 [Dissostichus eleginoides]|nr:hypothetical protein NQZ68_031488 [Dissostichus eleginoides]
MYVVQEADLPAKEDTTEITEAAPVIQTPRQYPSLTEVPPSDIPENNPVMPLWVHHWRGCGCPVTAVKAQLVDIAEHYKIAVVGSKQKDEIKAVIVSSLFEKGVLQKSEFGAAGVVPVVVQTAGLTFGQQKELLAMQFEQEKLRLEEDRLQFFTMLQFKPQM